MYSKAQEFVEGNPVNPETGPSLEKMAQVVSDITKRHGFETLGEPKLEKIGGVNSKTVLNFNTHDRGLLEVSISPDTSVVIKLMTGPGFAIRDFGPFNEFGGELLVIRNQIEEEVKGARVIFVDVDNAQFEPPEKIEVVNRGEDQTQPQVPLDEQELSFDAHKGNWYGHPKN